MSKITVMVFEDVDDDLIDNIKAFNTRSVFLIYSRSGLLKLSSIHSLKSFC